MADENRLNKHPVEAIEWRRGAVVVRLTGELDLYNAPTLRDALLQLIEKAPERLVIDLGNVDFVDSTILGVLIEARAKASDRRTFLLAAPGLEIRHALKISGLDDRLSLHDTVEAALEAPVV